MKTRETKPLPTTVIVAAACDWCGADLPTEGPRAGELRFEMEMRFTAGKSWPNDSYGDGWEVDLCQPCSEKLRAWLVEQGVKVREFDW